MSQPDRRSALIFVIGMHRSLTSCISHMTCRAFGAFHADPKDRIVPDSRNRLGYFESRRVYRLNESILEADGTTWRRVRTAPFVTCGQREQILGVLRDHYASRRVSVVKDPRLCLLASYWYAAAKELYGADRIFIIYAVRQPREVALSLQRSWGADLCEGVELWMFYNSRMLYFLSTLDCADWAVVDTSSCNPDHFEEVIDWAGIRLDLDLVARPGGVYSPAHQHFANPDVHTVEFPEPCRAELVVAERLYRTLSRRAIAKESFRIQDLEGDFDAQSGAPAVDAAEGGGSSG